MRATAENDLPSDEEADAPAPPRPFQVQSYKHLLQFPEIPAGGKATPAGNRDITVPIVDAIIVPTVRSADQIVSAVGLAVGARCQLVTLYTRNFPPGLPAILDRLEQGRVTPLALPVRIRHHLLDLAADLPQSLVSGCALDISRKRNLGLIIGRACGWTRMLFLDDDIRKLSVAKLGSAAALLDKYPVVGLQVNKYPDASVVGHARRLTGRRQEPFISGGSLLVNPQLLNGFFPPVYHEDWLCIVNHLRLGEVAIGGSVGQVPYQPFTTLERAVLEEFGDILMAALLWLVHTRYGKTAIEPASRDGNSKITDRDYWHEATTSHFWEMILSQRAALLDDIAWRVERLNSHPRLPSEGPRPSLQAAQQRCRELIPEEFVSFTEKWLLNLAAWSDSLSVLPRADSVSRALGELGLSQLVRTQEAHSRPAVARRTRWTGGFVRRWVVAPEPIPAAADSRLAGSRASNAASLSRAAWRSITSWQFLGYGPALSVAVPAGPAGPGRAYRPRPVLERKPRRVHSASWVSRFGGFMPSRLASSLPDQSWPGWLAMMRVTWSLLLPGQGGRGPGRGGWFVRRGRAAGRSGGGTRMVICTRVIVTDWQGRSWPRSWSRTW